MILTKTYKTRQIGYEPAYEFAIKATLTSTRTYDKSICIWGYHCIDELGCRTASHLSTFENFKNYIEEQKYTGPL